MARRRDDGDYANSLIKPTRCERDRLGSIWNLLPGLGGCKSAEATEPSLRTRRILAGIASMTGSCLSSIAFRSLKIADGDR